MKADLSWQVLAIPAASLLLTALLGTAAFADAYTVTDLVTDDPAAVAALGYPAASTVDPNLINPWGLDRSPTGPWVVANAFGTGTLTTYNAAGQIQRPAVATVQDSGQPTGPAGLVYSGGSGFVLPDGSSAQYFASNLDGSISGWNGTGGSTQLVVPGRVGGNLAAYTGLAIGQWGGQTYLYAVNNITGTIDVFNQSYQKVSLAGSFVDPGANPLGLVPFNVQNINGKIWITYAVPGPPADNQPLGSGFVAEFNADGTFVRRFATGGNLSSPWGITQAPSDFGIYSNDILIANFNDDTSSEQFISAFDPTTGAYLGKLAEPDGTAILLPGLWGIEFGNGANAGPDNTLYFAAGIDDEQHGLVGSITAVPEPPSWATMTGAMAMLAWLLAQRRRAKTRPT